MTAMMEPILSSIDTRILWVFLAVMALLLVLTIIKKAFKVTVFVGVVAAIALILIPSVNSFQEKYHFVIEDNKAMMVIDGNEYSISREGIKSMELQNLGNGNYALLAVMDDGNLSIEIPSFMRDGIKKFADRYGIKLKILD